GSSSAAAAPTSPIFLGDSIAKTLMVKGSPQELNQVRELITKLEETGPEVDVLGGTVRVLPMTGKSADRILDQIQYLWEARKKSNRIRIRTPAQPEAEPAVGETALPPAATESNSGKPAPTTTRGRTPSRVHYVG
ncbi:MAG: hypothetical protein ACK53L_18605, partial [Pirellulaceae bacterium]